MEPARLEITAIYQGTDLPKRAGLVQLVVDDGLIQVISLKTEPFDLFG